MISRSPHPTLQEMSWLSRFPEPVDIKQFGPIRDQAKSHPGFHSRSSPSRISSSTLSLSCHCCWEGGAYQDILLYILILCIYFYIFNRCILNMYIDWSLYIFLSNHLRSSNRFVDTSIGKHHQHMRCNTDVSGSKHLIRWHLSDTKSPRSLDASRMKLRPLQVEVEWSGFNKIAQHSGWLQVDFIPTVFFLLFWCRGCTTGTRRRCDASAATRGVISRRRGIQIMEVR